MIPRKTGKCKMEEASPEQQSKARTQGQGDTVTQSGEQMMVGWGAAQRNVHVCLLERKVWGVYGSLE